MAMPVPDREQQLRELNELVSESLRRPLGTTTLALRGVVHERTQQIYDGYTAEHDVEHGVSHLIAEVIDRLDGGFLDEEPPTQTLMEVAALLVAAIEVRLYAKDI